MSYHRELLIFRMYFLVDEGRVGIRRAEATSEKVIVEVWVHLGMSPLRWPKRYYWESVSEMNTRVHLHRCETQKSSGALEH